MQIVVGWAACIAVYVMFGVDPAQIAPDMIIPTSYEDEVRGLHLMSQWRMSKGECFGGLVQRHRIS